MSLPRARAFSVAIASFVVAAAQPFRVGAQVPTPPSPTPAADTLVVEPRPDSAAVVVRGDTLGFLYGRLGPFSVVERASSAAERIRSLRAQGADTSSVRLVEDSGRVEVWSGDVIVVTVTAQDTIGHETDMAETGAVMEAMVRSGLSSPALTRQLRDLLFGLAKTVLATVVLYWLFRLMARWYPRLYRRIRDIQRDKLRDVRFQGLVLLSGERIEAALLFLARVSRLLLTAVMVFGYGLLVFSFFPPTRILARRILAMAWEPTRVALFAVVGYLPNLFYIGVIAVLTYYGLRVVHLVFSALANGTIRIPGFFPDWAEPTFKLFRVLALAFAVILIWPYLPNSSSGAFRGVAAFMGLLVTFGSAGAVSNVVGGVVMIYMRPFHVGDRVKISDTVGDVVQRGMLVTRLRTPKNVEITIPNSMVLGSHIVNYSATAKEGGIILHTAVTIGYDVPWRDVHEAMKEAARRTEGIVQKPEPFVLQTALGDYAVSYELNACTEEPGRMAVLYSRLHENLQDSLAEAGIEILSPVYHSLRDGNPSTIPAPHTPPSSAAQAFRVRTVEEDGQA
ncbi:MAG: mechanosensitive ion channel family protein [Gemmatimonadetes bacterium]|nr:mechanosensitive ion channel family protein [Gemmatimonadota bacterium]